MQTISRIAPLRLSVFISLVLLGNLSFCAQDFPEEALKDPSNPSFWIFWECALKGDCKFDPSRPTERYFVFTNAASGNDSAAGTRAEPMQSIAAALSRAYTLQKRAVAVCAGNYSENALVLSLPISIYGSYNCTSWTRSATYGYPSFDGVNASTIQAGGYSASNTATLTALGGNITRSLVIDGFVIQGAPSGASGSIGLRIASGASPTVQNNQINGGSATGTSMAISMDSGDSYIANNRIDGGGGSSTSYGIYALSGAKGTIRANESISGGSGGTTHGIYATGAGTSLDIQENTLITGGVASTARAHGILLTNNAAATISDNSQIAAGTSTSNNTYGIYVQNGAGAAIRKNYITGGNAGAYSLGIEVWQTSTATTIEKNIIFGGYAPALGASLGINLNTNSSGTVIQNNLIHGGTSIAATRGLQIWTTSGTVYIYNNTILAGNNTAAATTIAINIGGSPAPPTIQNNILFCANGVSTYGLWEDDATSDPGIFQNNNIFNCSTALYRDMDGGGNLTTASAINALSDITASGNISVVMVGGPAYFTSVDGADANIDTMADNDWSLLSSTPASITQGGLDLSGLGVTEDYSSTTRTTPFSIGAYELDN